MSCDNLVLSRFTERRARYFVPILWLASLKVVGGWVIFHEFVSDLRMVVFPWYTAYATKGYLGQIPAYNSWLYLFCGWDTQFYVAIAKNWYFYPLYSFLPAYPVLIKILSSILNDYWFSASIISLVFGMLSLPVFQRIAEYYMSKIESFYCTLIFGSFPYIFLYTTVAYSESLFIFTTMLAWLLYKRGQMFSCSLACAAASLTKIYGVVIVFPILLDLTKDRNLRKALFVFIPLAFVLGWQVYRFWITGYWLGPPTSESHWAIYGLSFGYIQHELWPINQAMGGESLARFGLVLVLSILAASSWHLDWRLGSYSMSMLGLLLVFGTIESLPRFLSFIYPMWLVPRFRGLVPVMVLLTLFALADLRLWYQFLIAEAFIA